jgi:hypothetical protein
MESHHFPNRNLQYPVHPTAKLSPTQDDLTPHQGRKLAQRHGLHLSKAKYGP